METTGDCSRYIKAILAPDQGASTIVGIDLRYIGNGNENGNYCLGLSGLGILPQYWRFSRVRTEGLVAEALGSFVAEYNAQD